MTKFFALVLLPLMAIAVRAQPVSENDTDRLARIEAADREFLAKTADPAGNPPPLAVAAPAIPVAAAPPKALAIEKPAPVPIPRAEPSGPPQAGKPASPQRQASAKKSAPKKVPAARRAVPVVPENFTVRTEERGRTVFKHYEFSKSGSRTVKVTTTTISRADRDDDDDDEDDD